MSASAPTARGTLCQAKTTYISWGSFNFELVGSNTFRPALSAANETEVVSNAKTYKSYTANVPGIYIHPIPVEYCDHDYDIS